MSKLAWVGFSLMAIGMLIPPVYTIYKNWDKVILNISGVNPLEVIPILLIVIGIVLVVVAAMRDK
jgi:hypothetical protein